MQHRSKKTLNEQKTAEAKAKAKAKAAEAKAQGKAEAEAKVAAKAKAAKAKAPAAKAKAPAAKAKAKAAKAKAKVIPKIKKKIPLHLGIGHRSFLGQTNCKYIHYKFVSFVNYILPSLLVKAAECDTIPMFYLSQAKLL